MPSLTGLLQRRQSPLEIYAGRVMASQLTAESAVPLVPVSQSMEDYSFFTFACLLFFTWLSYGLRFFTRRHYYLKQGWDDWFMLLALLLFTTFIGLAIDVHKELYHKTMGIVDTMNRIAIYLLVAEFFYTWGMIALKTSLALFFNRFITARWHKIVLIMTLAVVWITSLMHFLLSVFQCGVPGHGPSLFIKKIGYECTPIRIILGIGLTHAIANAVTDWILVALPISIVVNTKIKPREKKFIIFLLILAASGSIVSIVRLPYIKNLVANGQDFWPKTQGLTLTSSVEQGIGIIAANLAALGPLLRKTIEMLRSYRSRSSSSPKHTSSFGNEGKLEESPDPNRGFSQDDTTMKNSSGDWDGRNVLLTGTHATHPHDDWDGKDVLLSGTRASQSNADWYGKDVLLSGTRNSRPQTSWDGRDMLSNTRGSRPYTSGEGRDAQQQQQRLTSRRSQDRKDWEGKDMLLSGTQSSQPESPRPAATKEEQKETWFDSQQTTIDDQLNNNLWNAPSKPERPQGNKQASGRWLNWHTARPENGGFGLSGYS